MMCTIFKQSIKSFEEILINTSHKNTQVTVWQYIHHVANLLGLEEEKDYIFKNSSKFWDVEAPAGDTNVDNKKGFMLLDDKVAAQYMHYLEIGHDTSCDREHLLAGFWINNWHPEKEVSGISHIPDCVPGRKHQEERQVISDGKGYIIGLRRSTAELIQLFNTKYGEVYGPILSEVASVESPKRAG